MEEAVLIHQTANNLPSESYQKYDVSTLKDQMIKVFQENYLDKYDGNEFGPAETIIYLYGQTRKNYFLSLSRFFKRIHYAKMQK